LQGGQPEPAFPVRKTGVGDLRGHGVALVIGIDNGGESGCRVEQVEGIFLGSFKVKVVSPCLRPAVPSFGQILSLIEQGIITGGLEHVVCVIEE